jgi:hypothetical protein
VYDKYFPIVSLVGKVISSGIISDEPFEIPEGYTPRLVEEFEEHRSIFRRGIKRIDGC